MKRLISALPFLLIAFTGTLYAQRPLTGNPSPVTDTTANPVDSTDKRLKSYVTAGVQYLSDNVYYGRKDSVRVSYLSPRLSYYHKSGVFVSGTASLLTAPDKVRIDAGTLTAGYQFSLGNLDGEVSASKYFYSDQSQNVQSEVKGNVDANINYDLGDVVSLYMDGALNFGDINDYSAMLSIDHIFYLANDRLRIDPAFTARAGTSHFYESYYNLRNINRNRTRKGKPAVIADVSDAAKFNILSYDFSTFVFYTINKKFTLLFTPVYTIPVHPAVISLKVPATGVVKSNTEQLSNQFYWSVGFSCKF